MEEKLTLLRGEKSFVYLAKLLGRSVCIYVPIKFNTANCLENIKLEQNVSIIFIIFFSLSF